MDATWSFDGSTVELAFTLPAGSYATVLLDDVMKSAG
jgi:tRNA(Glu) U13 pseudouridine synthase TruD